MKDPQGFDPDVMSQDVQTQAAPEFTRAARHALTLQRVSAALASRLDRDQVLEAIVRSSLDAVGAVAGAVTELTEDRLSLRLVCAVGYPAELTERFALVPFDASSPMAHLVRQRLPVFVQSRDELERIAPSIARYVEPGGRAMLPLFTQERFLGMLVLTFGEERTFSEDERDFLLAVAQQCAVALQRSELFERERKARADAEAATERLAEALDRMSDLHFVCDHEWRYTRMNRATRAFMRDSGYDPDELMHRVIWEKFPLLVGGEMHRAMLRASEEGVSVPFAARGRYADSHYEGHAYPLRSGVAVHAHDTSDRRRAEEEVARLTAALKRRVDEMETLLRVIPVGIGIASDPLGRQIAVNPAFAEILGVDPGINASKSGPNGAALPFRIFQEGREVTPDDLPLQVAARTGALVPYQEFDLLRSDGTSFTLLETAAPVLDDNGLVRGSVGAFVDITARKRTETSSRILAAASAAFAVSMDVGATFSQLVHSVVPAMADVGVIFVVRDSGSVGVVAMHSTDPVMFEMLRDFDRTHPVDSTPGHPVWRVLREGRSILVSEINEVEFTRDLSEEADMLDFARVSGTTSILIVPVAARGQILGAMGLGTRTLRRRFDSGDLALAEELGRRAGLALDNARLLEAEQRARAEAETARAQSERASRAKSDFLAMMSHELRTPLNAIAGYAELIELGLRGPVTEEQLVDLQKIRQNQRHLLGLINSVLSFARLDAGRVIYDLANVPLAASLKAVESLIEPQVSERAIAYACTSCDARVTVRADSEKLQQILLNLLGNAVKFTEWGGSIEVACDTRAHDVEIHVRDTGIGIAAEHLDAIFEPFVQANRTLTQSKDGVGLGLAISRELARGMGGDLRAQSKLQEGSTFSLTLPRGPDRTPLR